MIPPTVGSIGPSMILGRSLDCCPFWFSFGPIVGSLVLLCVCVFSLALALVEAIPQRARPGFVARLDLRHRLGRERLAALGRADSDHIDGTSHLAILARGLRDDVHGEGGQFLNATVRFVEPIE